MLRLLAIVSGLATASVLLAPTAFADEMCKYNYEHCDEVVMYTCRDSHHGYHEFIGGSDFGEASSIALGKAAGAGYDVGDSCHRRDLR
jgi:hypothetical protein